MTPKRKSYIADYCKRRRERLQADGLCIDCGKVPSESGIQRCIPCNSRMLGRSTKGKGDFVEDGGTGATIGEIADELGVGRERARQILLSAIRKFKKACRRHGIDPSDITGAPRSMLARAEDWA